MQQNNQPNGFRRFLRQNGYSLLIGFCALAVGVSGFFLLRSRAEQKTEEALSVPAVAETAAPAETTGRTTRPAAADDEESAAAAVPPADTAEEADNLQPEAAVPAGRIVVSPVSGETISAYSMTALAYNATTRDWRTHDGVDLAAAPGTPVSASEAGTVTAVYQDDYLGAAVEITHASGYKTLYANLEENPPVSVGQTVSAGDAIGSVGQTALLEVGEAPHLHFAVSLDSASVDPLAYLS